jgi:hypothetical protein
MCSGRVSSSCFTSDTRRVNRTVSSDQEYSNRGDIYLKHYSSKAPKNENLSNHFRITLEKS